MEVTLYLKQSNFSFYLFPSNSIVGVVVGGTQSCDSSDDRADRRQQDRADQLSQDKEHHLLSLR